MCTDKIIESIKVRNKTAQGRYHDITIHAPPFFPL